MATTVDTLLVRIEADLKGLRRDLNKVEQTTKRSADNMGRNLKNIDGGFQKIGRTVKALAPILAGALGAGAIRSFVRVGSQVENLRVRLRFLFGDVEEGAKAFDVMAQFASRVPFSLQEIQNASGTLASVAKNANQLNELLKITGNVAAISGLRFEDAAGNLQRAFSAGANSADLFREKGILALAGFEAGAKVSIDETIRKFSEAFGTGGKFDGATKELASTFTGQMSMLGDAVLNFQRQVVDSGLLEAFKELVKFLRDNVAQTDRLAQVIGKTLAAAVRGLTKALKFVLDNLNAIIIAIAVFASLKTLAAISAMGIAFVAFASDVLKAGTALKSINRILKASPLFLIAAVMAGILAETDALDGVLTKVKDKFSELFPAVNDTEEATANLTSTIKNLASDLSGDVAKAPDDFTKTITKLKDEAKMANAELLGMDAALVQALQSAGGLGNIRGNTLAMPKDEEEREFLGVPLTGLQIRELIHLVKEQKKATAALDKHNEAMEEGKAVAQSFIPEQVKLQQTLDNVRLAMNTAAAEDLPLYEEAIKDLQHQIKMTNPEFERLHNAAMRAADGVSNALADAFVNGKLSLQSLGDVFKQVIKQMIADAIKAQIIKHIINPIFGAIGIPMGAGGRSVGGVPNNSAQANSLLSHAGGGGVRRRATGGPVLVGERGPELFIPHSAGVIRNNHDTMNMMGGAPQPVVNQTINIDAGVSQTVRAEVISMIPRIKQETIAAMMDGKRRGTSISKVF